MVYFSSETSPFAGGLVLLLKHCEGSEKIKQTEEKNYV